MGENAKGIRWMMKAFPPFAGSLCTEFCFDCAEFKTKMSPRKLKEYEKVRPGE